MKRSILTTVAICTVLMIGAVTYGQDPNDFRTKVGTSGTWGLAGNWERYNGSSWVNADYYPGHPSGPDPQEVNILYTTAVDVGDAEALTLNVDANLTINTNGVLIVTGDGETSDIASGYYIQINGANGSPGELRFTGDHTVQGDGTIIGTSNYALLRIADGKTLTSEVQIHGGLVINEVSGNATFYNKDEVQADGLNLTLEVATDTIRDDTGNRWYVVTEPTATLRFSDDATGNNKLVGNFDLNAGTLDIWDDVTTSGTLDAAPNTTINVAAGKTFQAS